MLRTMLKSKIHRATVTHSNLNYVGSITIDGALLEEVGIIENEKVLVVNINTGARFETYVLLGERYSGVICLNGAAARLVQTGDKIIILAFGMYDNAELENHSSTVIFVDEENKVISKNLVAKTDEPEYR